MLHKLLGDRTAFPFPKSLYAVRDTLATVVRDRPNALILDFFAGSGTTLHATALINALDGGSRRCILVSNNEVAAKTSDRLLRAGDLRLNVDAPRLRALERRRHHPRHNPPSHPVVRFPGMQPDALTIVKNKIGTV